MLVVEEPGHLGSQLPAFALPGVDGKSHRASDFSLPVTVAMFICNHCPYVKAVEDRLIRLATLYSESVSFFAISSNDPVRYPQDGFEAMKQVSMEKKYPFPYLFDESQDVARAFGAKCTPDIFVYDAQRRLAYRGLIDDNWKEVSQVQRAYLREAIDALLAGQRPMAEQPPSIGCSIKWTY